MNLNKVLESINNINDYISASRNVDLEVIQMERMQLNMTTILAMKKIQAFEIEYYNEYRENGFACIVITLVLKHPPSKAWSILGKELVSLLKYWLDALRKNLISQNPLWWSFLKVILKFIKEIRPKHSTIPNTLVEQTSECLLDLSTSDKCDERQKFEILHCLNIYCAESTREIRFAMRNKYSDYFIKLSIYMSTCGHLPCQFVIMETLLRWLVPRHNHDVRSNSAIKWFPKDLYSQKTIDIFLERPWTNFFQDARDFLNSHNETNDLIESFVCKRLCIGDLDLITGTEKQDLWLDVNTRGRCISLFLYPDMLDKLRVKDHSACEVLVISEDNTNDVQLYSESLLITISVTTLSTPEVIPSTLKIADEVINSTKIVVSSRSNPVKLDKALRKIFGDKYHLMMDLRRKHTLSPENVSQSSLSRIHRNDKEVKFSQAIAKRRNRRSGYVVKLKNPAVFKSPSTTSTTSLAHLHEKLVALPSFKYDKIPMRVCESPNLTKVTEASETRQTVSSLTEVRLTASKRHGVSHRSIRESTIRTSQNVNEANPNITDKSLDKNADHSTSCLLIATIGSTDESIISNTIERLSKNKDYKSDNIVDLLIKEALKNNIQESDTAGHSNINTTQHIGENEEAIEKRELEVTPEKQDKKNCAVRNRSSSTDGSNTNIINETPFNNITFRTKNLYRKKKPIENVLNDDFVNNDAYDDAIVNDFFRQHFTGNSDDNIVISSKLAKNINATSSETSENYADNIMNEIFCQNINFMLDDVEVLDCLNSILDKVCNEFQKGTDYLNHKYRRPDELDKIDNYEGDNNDFKESSKNENNNASTIKLEQNNIKSNNNLQLKFPVETNKKKSNNIKSITKSHKKKKDEYITTVVEQEQASITMDKIKKMPKRNTKRTYKRKDKGNSLNPTSNIEESTKVCDGTGKENIVQKDESSTPYSQKKENEPNKTPADVVRRKRKLYSPVIESANKDFSNKQASDMNEDIPVYNNEVKPKTLNFNAVSYKDIERERKNYVRRPRNLRSKMKVVEIHSPRTQKINEAFDRLKETIENNNEIFIDVKSTNNNDVYNFTSDSDDEDFKRKNIRVIQRTSATGGTADPTLSTKRGTKTKRVNNKQKVSNNKKSKTRVTKNNKVDKRKANKGKINIPMVNLVDETMRESKADVLNTSFIIEQPKSKANDHPEPILSEIPHMEGYSIHDKKMDNKNKLLVKNLEIHYQTLSDDRTRSPLPELIVEATALAKDNVSDSIRSDFLKSLKNKYMNSDVYLNKPSTTRHSLLDTETNNLNERPFNNNIQADINNISHFEASEKNTKPRFSNEINKIHDLDEDIIEIEEVNSEKSIATDGITAHGDFDESPPYMKYINKKVSPRNLELEALDKSTREYYNRLESRINHSGRNSQSSEVNKAIEITKSSANRVEKIPCVMLSRLTLDDIKKILNSDENFAKLSVESDKNVQERNKSIITDKRLTHAELPKATASLNDKCLLKSPDCSRTSKGNTGTNGNKNIKGTSSTVSNKSYIIKCNKYKCLPSSRSSYGDFQDNLRHLRSKSSISRLSNDNEEKRQTYENNNSTGFKLIYNTLEATKHAVDAKNTEGLNVKHRNKRQNVDTKHKENKRVERKSTISPIKLEFLTQHQQTKTSETTEDGSVNNNKHKSIHDAPAISPKRYKFTESRESESNFNVEHKEVLSPASSGAQSEVSRMKRKWPETVFDVLSNKKLNITHCNSDKTASSVHEWFERNDAAQNKDMDVKNLVTLDTLWKIYETLDTTFTEMNIVTNKKMVNMLVNVHKESEERKEERRRMFEKSIKKLLDEIHTQVNFLLVDFENKLQAEHENFLKQLRKSASNVLIEDSKQKQGILLLIKQDIVNAIKQVRRSRKE